MALTMETLEQWERIAKEAKANPIGGLEIRESVYLVETVEDWSRVRSVGRATRRRAQGHPQNITVSQKPMMGGYLVNGTLFMHPETARAVKAELQEKINSGIRNLAGTIFGNSSPMFGAGFWGGGIIKDNVT